MKISSKLSTFYIKDSIGSDYAVTTVTNNNEQDTNVVLEFDPKVVRMDMGKKGLYMIQSLVFAYIATGILLCLLAFIIYQSNAGMKIANLGITLTYILASVFAGILIGSKIGKKKFLWGFAAGMLYFMILTLISWIFQKNIVLFSTERITACFLCIAGGTLGGMLAI